MAFTEEEKRKWHADRRAGRLTDDHLDDVGALVCIHCGNPFPGGAGIVTDEIALCDVCNGD